MSRTRHHRNQRHHHTGEDFWSRRAGMGHYPYSAYGKRLTIAKERMAGKGEVMRELRRPDSLSGTHSSNIL